MTNLTTTWLITEIQTVTIDKLKAQTLLNELEIELQQSDLVARINKGKEYLKELTEKETEIKNQWIEILQKSNIDKFEANWIEVRLKTSPWRVVITEEDLVPDEYKKEVVKTTISIDKKALWKAMKEWEIFDGVILEKDVSLEISYK